MGAGGALQVKEGKKAKFTLGVFEAKLGNAISDGLGVPCACNEFTGELLRGVRAHAAHLTKVKPPPPPPSSSRPQLVSTRAPIIAMSSFGSPNCWCCETNAASPGIGRAVLDNPMIPTVPVHDEFGRVPRKRELGR